MRISKEEAARRQLETAIELYLTGKDFISAITLAGAAEEILGKLLAHKAQTNMMSNLIELDKAISGGRPFKTVNEEVNKVRNWIKHARDKDEPQDMEIEEGEAIAMILRAVVNYNRLTGQITEPMIQAYRTYSSNKKGRI